MNASTRVAQIASQLSASWTGFVSAERASVVLLWPEGEKAYLDIDADGERVSPESHPERAAQVGALLTKDD